MTINRIQLKNSSGSGDATEAGLLAFSDVDAGGSGKTFYAEQGTVEITDIGRSIGQGFAAGGTRLVQYGAAGKAAGPENIAEFAVGKQIDPTLLNIRYIIDGDGGLQAGHVAAEFRDRIRELDFQHVPIGGGERGFRRRAVLVATDR